MNQPCRVGLLTVGLALAVLSMSSLEAQERGRRGGRGEFRGGSRGVGGFRGPRRPIDKATLLGVEEVQDELALNDEQKKTVSNVLAAYRESRRDGRPGDLDKNLAEVLGTEQRKRLSEVKIQQQGTDALTDAAVAAALKLTGEQMEKIKASIAWGREERSKLFSSFGGGGGRARRDSPPRGRGRGFPDFGRMREEGERIRKEVDAKALAVLSDAQKNELDDLKGEPFELDPRSLFRGRGGRGGGFGFGGGGAAERLDPDEVEFRDGAGTIADRATFNKLSYQGSEVLIDTHLDGIQFVKFQIENARTDEPQLYFMNTKTHRAHMMFMRAVGLGRGGGGQMRGVLVYRPLLKAPGGKPGLYTYEFEPNDSFSFEMVKIAHDLLVDKMPILKERIGYYPMPGAMTRYKREKELYDAANFPAYLDKDLYTDIGYLPLNLSESFGRLRLMELDERPTSRDVVLYKTLPSEMHRVAGIITGVRQTPLSHVNLRAIQDDVPNAFITGAWESETIAPLIGKYVYYKVAADTYELREASPEEVEAHFAGLRPTSPQVPARDFSVTKIKPLDEIKFGDSSSFGVKTTNLATMRTFGFPEGTVPDGSGIPFYFYDAFMEHNSLYKTVASSIEDPEFQKDRKQQAAELKRIRRLVQEGDLPDWMFNALGDLQKSFPAGTSIRCRSSTNNEDLPGFSGAGLYDSFTHYASEGHLSKSIKQVFASLWNFRAFEEREFYRIDHFATVMGVLVHPNYKDEVANGVAVTDDILYQTQGNFYLNAQVGEDLVTNPREQSTPEETLLDWWESSRYRMVRNSNRTVDGGRVLTDAHLGKLRSHLSKIHGKFCELYGHSLEDEGFAMEIEFKVTTGGTIAIKQARPWVY